MDPSVNVWDISIVMVTYNRREILCRSLMLYNEQAGMNGRFEVVLVVDGSTDGTLDTLEALRPELRYPLTVLVLAANDGPAKSRNQAIAAARGSLAYGDIENGTIVPYSRLYTSNVSFKRRFLTETAERLDERLHYGFEDSEWGLRLSRKGMELRYNAAAIGNHLHPTTLDAALRRMKSIGATAATLRRVNRDEFDRVTAGLFTPENRWRRVLAGVVLNPILAKAVYIPLARLCEHRIVVDRIFAAAHTSAMMAGLREGGLPDMAESPREQVGGTSAQ